MAKLKVGDRVRVHDADQADSELVSDTGTVALIYDSGAIKVNHDAGKIALQMMREDLAELRRAAKMGEK